MYVRLGKNKHIRDHLDEFLRKKELKKKANNGKPILTRDNKRELLFKYCKEHNEVPSQTTTYENFKLGEWFRGQKRRIRSITDIVYKELSVNECVKKYLDEYLKSK